MQKYSNALVKSVTCVLQNWKLASEQLVWRSDSGIGKRLQYWYPSYTSKKTAERAREILQKHDMSNIKFVSVAADGFYLWVGHLCVYYIAPINLIPLFMF